MKFNALTKLNFVTKKHPWFGLNILLRQTDVIWQVPTGLFLVQIFKVVTISPKIFNLERIKRE